MALRDRVHYVLRFRHAHQTTTTVDRSGKEHGEGHQEISGIFSLLVETKEPLPGQRTHFLDGVGFSIGVEMAEVDPTMQLDPGQDVEKAGVQFVEGIALVHWERSPFEKGTAPSFETVQFGETEPPATAETFDQGWRRVVKGRAELFPEKMGLQGPKGTPIMDRGKADGPTLCRDKPGSLVCCQEKILDSEGLVCWVLGSR